MIHCLFCRAYGVLKADIPLKVLTGYITESLWPCDGIIVKLHLVPQFRCDSNAILSVLFRVLLAL